MKRKSLFLALDQAEYGMNRKRDSIGKWEFALIPSIFSVLDFQKENLNHSFFPNSAHYTKEYNIQNGRKKSPFIFKVKI